MSAILPVSTQDQNLDIFECDVKEDMVTMFVKHYGFFNAKEGALGTVQVTRHFVVKPSLLESSNPFALRTWYVLKDKEGNTEALATQTWASIISGIFSFILGDSKYFADYTIYNKEWDQIGYIDGHAIGFGREFDLISGEEEQASVRIGVDTRFAHIYRGDSEGKVGEIKVDCETREKGDYKLVCQKGIVDERVLKIFSTITLRQALIYPDEGGCSSS